MEVKGIMLSEMIQTEIDKYCMIPLVYLGKMRESE